LKGNEAAKTVTERINQLSSCNLRNLTHELYLVFLFFFFF